MRKIVGIGWYLFLATTLTYMVYKLETNRTTWSNFGISLILAVAAQVMFMTIWFLTKNKGVYPFQDKGWEDRAKEADND